jgi:immune inhibitor A
MKYRLAILLTTCLAPGLAASSGVASDIVENLATFQFDKLGHPQIKSDSIKPVLASADRPHRLLILPITFADVSFDRFAGDPDQEKKNREYFQTLLFAGSPQNPVPGTLSDYYRHQSRGRYNITGDILPTVHLQNPLRYYGRPIQKSDGNWRSDVRTEELVEQALLMAFKNEPGFPWRDYDQWDPQDFDGDGNRDEPDGYLDHLVLVIAGKGQENCQGLYNLDEKLNRNSPPEAVDALTKDEQACADRLWAHRSALLNNLGSGPSIEGTINPRGGLELAKGLWIADYNMQTEYTEAATFIHEFGHSIGLPDIYAGTTSNSTASWDVMSATADPIPQEMSTWSRMVLGWLQPCVVYPPAYGGEDEGALELKTMNDWSSQAAPGLCDAAMIILPPKYRDITMGPLTTANGKLAAYSGQGNDIRRTLSRDFDFTNVDGDTSLILSLDAWFEIEAEWDYLYVEVSIDGKNFVRLMPLDKSAVSDRSSVMPATKGHEGEGSAPGFTGLSGDRDGDNKVESAPGCEPDKPRTLAEDLVEQGVNETGPCEQADWSQAEFDLGSFRGQLVTLRFNYFTDGAAVENGALVDNVKIEAIGFSEDFESASLADWDSTGFTLSGGNHHLAVPHFYLLEYRDPYADFDSGTNYDRALKKPRFLFYPDNEGAMQAININYRPGLLLWYYNGEYLWSQNEPSELGSGNGFLLLVDANPQEFKLDVLPQSYFSSNAQGWTAWELDEDAQAIMHDGFLATMCYQRRPQYYSSDVTAEDRASCKGSIVDGAPPMEALQWNGRDLMYGYTLRNELLPGTARVAKKSAGGAFDLRLRDGETQYRLNDGALRNRHSADAPFSLTTFDRGVETYRNIDGDLTALSAAPFPPAIRFDDAVPGAFLNPRLPFGSANIPSNGFSFELAAAQADSPEGSRVRVVYRWEKAR